MTRQEQMDTIMDQLATTGAAVYHKHLIGWTDVADIRTAARELGVQVRFDFSQPGACRITLREAGR